MNVLKHRIQSTLNRLVPDHVEIGFICFTSDEHLHGVLTASDNAQALMAPWKIAKEINHD
jgi:hypothetical protein